MTNNAQKAMRGVMKEVLLDVLPVMFREYEIRFDQRLDDLKMNLRDEIHSTVKASEAGLIRRMDALELRLRNEILDGVNDIIGDGVLPQIDTIDHRVAQLKQVSSIA